MTVEIAAPVTPRPAVKISVPFSGIWRVFATSAVRIGERESPMAQRTSRTANATRTRGDPTIRMATYGRAARGAAADRQHQCRSDARTNAIDAPRPDGLRDQRLRSAEQPEAETDQRERDD